jgi:hypothetical protein
MNDDTRSHNIRVMGHSLRCRLIVFENANKIIQKRKC